MDRLHKMNPRERLVFHVQECERLEALKQEAAELLREAFSAAKGAGYDVNTLKVVLKLRKMTPAQRSERRALEAIYLAALGLLEGESLPDAARRRLDQLPSQPGPSADRAPDVQPESATRREDEPAAPPEAPPPPQPALVLKTPDEARQEGAAAALAGKRVYDNPYPAGDLCRAAWDEGWCAQQGSHGMDTPAAYQRRSGKAPDPGAAGTSGSGDERKNDKDGKSSGAGAEDQRGAA